MSDFIVSARKYRPQHFDTVVGQSHITTTLLNAISQNHLAHAYLFCGPRGVGKTTCARILAKTINCEKRTKQHEACEKCDSCISFNKGNSLNFFELDAASNNSVDDIRELVEQVRFIPQAGKYKVYIVDEVHMLSSSAFNAFLKTLEEPPAHAIFILATTEKHKILPTILSRCQIFDFKRIVSKDITDHLEQICNKEKVSFEAEALHIIAQKSEGCMRDALSILDKIVSFTNSNLTYTDTLEHLNILDETYFFELHQAFQKEDIAATFKLFETIHQKGFEGDTFLNALAGFYRNVLLSQDEKTLFLLDVPEGFKVKYLQTAQETKTAWLVTALHYLNESEIQFRLSKNKRLHVELSLIKLLYLNQAVTISANEPQAIADGKSIKFRAASVRKIKNIVVETQTNNTIIKTAETKKEELVPAVFIEKNIIIPNTKQIESKSISSLSKIRNQYKEQIETALGKDIFTYEQLLENWQSYAANLKLTNQAAATNFEMAKLDTNGIDNITINAVSNFSKKFIENYKTDFISFLQKKLNNYILNFELPDIIETEDENKEETLSTKMLYQKLVDEYPNIKLLKDTLKLDLDY